MEIEAKEFGGVEVITVQGRVDSVHAGQLARALESASHRGIHKIIVDMGQLEYMSSAGFRALGDAQRRSLRHPGGEVVLAQVPVLIREALELVGFTENFHLADSVSTAREWIATRFPGDPTTTAPAAS